MHYRLLLSTFLLLILLLWGFWRDFLWPYVLQILEKTASHRQTRRFKKHDFLGNCSSLCVCRWPILITFFSDENKVITKLKFKRWWQRPWWNVSKLSSTNKYNKKRRCRQGESEEQSYGHILHLMTRKIRSFINLVEQRPPVNIYTLKFNFQL